MYHVEIKNEGSSKFSVKAKDCEFTIDTKADGCSPPDTLLASLGSCVGVYIRKYAEGSNVEIPGFRVTVEGDLSRESPVSFKVINIAVHLEGPGIDDRRKKALLAFIQNCPVHNTLKYNPEIKITLF